MTEHITTIALDMGGVIFKIDSEQAIGRFIELGVTNARHYMGAFAQTGLFGDLESGRISAEEFRQGLSAMAGRELTLDDCRNGWTSYLVEPPAPHTLEAIEELRARGYRMVLLSNTNPFMMSWTRSIDFDGIHPEGIAHYFDAMYLSYEMRVMKPSAAIFEQMLAQEGVDARQVIFVDDSAHNIEAAAAVGLRTLLTSNGGDWYTPLLALLSADGPR